MLRSARREFLTRTACVGATALLPTGVILLSAGKGAVADDVDEAGRKVIDRWMSQWMSHTKQVTGRLDFGRFADLIYFLLRPIRWEPDQQPSEYSAVTVPTGFVTDLASIPRIFWSLFQPDGRYAYAAAVHDYLYWIQQTTKDVADNVFRQTMQDFSVGAITINTLFEAVHLFGQAAWNENARLKGLGEKRILKVFPEDPRTQWSVWKKDPNHFAD
jgi:hypothetical protein